MLGRACQFACTKFAAATQSDEIMLSYTAMPHRKQSIGEQFAGGFSTVISGAMNLRLNMPSRITIGGTGALAVFIVVYFFLPANVAFYPVGSSERSPCASAPPNCQLSPI